MVLLRVPMMRRPIFLAYHTELSMLLVAAAAAAAVKVEVVSPPLRLLSLLLQAAGWLRWCWLESRRWEGASLHLVPPLLFLLLLFLTDTNTEAAEMLMEELAEVTRRRFQQRSDGAERSRDAPRSSSSCRLGTAAVAGSRRTAAVRRRT